MPCANIFSNMRQTTGEALTACARKTTETYEETRSRLGKFLNVSPDHIIFTKNTTDSVNTVANGLPWKRGDEIITTWLERRVSNLLPG